MSFTSEMSRITAEFEAAQSARLGALTSIGSGVRRENQRNKASLMGAMTAHRVATKSSLRDIFGTAAFARGAAVELIERFRNEREESTSDLRDQLGSYAANLRETVGEELADLAATRAKMARREQGARRAQLKDVHRRVEALLAGSDKLIESISRDRQRAGRIWEQHLSNASRLRRAAARAAAEDFSRTAQADRANEGKEAKTRTRLSMEAPGLLPDRMAPAPGKQEIGSAAKCSARKNRAQSAAPTASSHRSRNERRAEN